MKKPKGPGKGVRVTNPLVPAHHQRHRRHKKPGKPHHHHHPGPGGVRANSPLPGPGKPVHLHKAPHHHKHKKPKQPVKRKLSIGDVACCAAEALAASLRLAGVPVRDEDVLALYWHTAADADAGATILETLVAAQEFGLAGVRLASFRPAREYARGVVVGCKLPGGQHAMTLDEPGLVWSWGELYDDRKLGRSRIDEAWQLEWST